MKQELVKDWMTQAVITVTPEMRLTEAHRLMTDKNIRRLPVVKNDQLLGIITRGDIREAEPSTATSLNVWEMNYLISKLRVKDVMTRNLVTISVNATIADAAKVMLEKKISGLPVIEDKKVVGIITESDIFRMIVQAWHQIE